MNYRFTDSAAAETNSTVKSGKMSKGYYSPPEKPFLVSAQKKDDKDDNVDDFVDDFVDDTVADNDDINPTDDDGVKSPDDDISDVDDENRGKKNSSPRKKNVGKVKSNNSKGMGQNTIKNSMQGKKPSSATKVKRTMAPKTKQPTKPTLPAPPIRPPSQPSAPSPSPPTPTTLGSCVPTTGLCVSTAEELQTALDEADAGAVVAICGGSDPTIPTTLSTTATITLNQAELVLCCEGAKGSCVFESTGETRNLQVTADSVTLQDLHFVDGVSDGSFGGNVAIEGEGSHTIIGCEFRNGFASSFGGNLYVQTAGDITIEDSLFIDGTANEAGGGVYVLNAGSLTVVGSDFSNNEAVGGSGGGLFSTVEDPSSSSGQNILFDNTDFTANLADMGGGFLTFELGISPSLQIVNCFFNGNEVDDAGGAGAIADSLDILNLQISNSRADGNIAENCPNILAFSGDDTPECLAITEDFP